MALSSRKLKSKEIIYPESDGKPMADNTKQWRWIVLIKSGLDLLFRNSLQVFIAGDLLWYPVEGQPKIRQAPDAMVIFGRPKGDRGSYKQWEEGGIAPQVVFEVLSPGNTGPEMRTKREFYERYDVQEYYQYDPDRIRLEGWIRRGVQLVPVAQMNGWVSPLLGVRFELHPNDTDQELKLFNPDGTPFLDYIEIDEQRRQAEQQRRQAEQQAEQERQQRLEAEQRAEKERLERERLERLIARMKAKGIELEEDEGAG